VIFLDGADLTGADLEGMGLCTHSYTAEDLFGMTDSKARAELLGVYLSNIAQPTASVNLARVDLSGANLRDTDRRGAMLFNANYT
jgi:uncharacterized protein YjbI with pentapeptide repeats